MLTDVQVRKAKPTDQPFKMADAGGLHLYVTPAGGKLWRYRYRVDGKEKLLSLGAYPALSLAEARQARDKAKADQREGRDPAVVKRQAQHRATLENAETFEVVAREWHELQKPVWSKHHAWDVLNSLETDVFPAIGRMPIRQVTSPDILHLLRKVERRGAIETGRRIRQRVSAVFDFAISTSRATADPAAPVKGSLAPLIKGRQPAVKQIGEARAIVEAVESKPAHVLTRLAMRLLALTVVRPGTLVTTPWAEFRGLDPDEPTWRISAARMKLKLRFKSDEDRDHLVPLSRQAVETINAIHHLTGAGPFVLPSQRNAHKPMSENAIGYMLNRAGYHGRHVPHGWRSTFSTVLNERFPVDRAIIDLALAHVPKEKVEAAYNRASHVDRRRELFQIWADMLLDGMPSADDVLGGLRRVEPVRRVQHQPAIGLAVGVAM